MQILIYWSKNERNVSVRLIEYKVDVKTNDLVLVEINA